MISISVTRKQPGPAVRDAFVLSCFALLGCKAATIGIPDDTDRVDTDAIETGDSDTDVDTDADADSDTDVDTDADADSDTDVDTAPECVAGYPSVAAAGKTCDGGYTSIRWQLDARAGSVVVDVERSDGQGGQRVSFPGDCCGVLSTSFACGVQLVVTIETTTESGAAGECVTWGGFSGACTGISPTVPSCSP